MAKKKKKDEDLFDRLRALGSPRASAAFWELVPKMEAICGGGLIFPREGQMA
jgi:hypothetical protein